MSLEFLIARRMAKPSPENRPGVMERIAVISVALSVAVMLLSLSVIMGFKRDVTQKITGFAAHAVVTDIGGIQALDSEPVDRTAHLEEMIRSTPGFVSMAPYAARGGIVRTSDAVLGIVLKGVGAEYDWVFFEKLLLRGELPRVSDTLRTKDVLISQLMADQLLLDVGDRVEMLFVESGQAPRRDRFKVSGVYSSGMDEMDKSMVMTDIRNVQRLADWTPEQVTGYEIYTSDLSRVGEFSGALERTLLYDDAEESENLAVSSVTELYPNIFDWLKAHDVNAAIIIVIMLIVAFFNMASALLILVLERIRMVGLLKAMGMRNGALRRIFLYRAAFITLRGLVWGNGVGLSLCLIQEYFHVVKLNAEGYLLSEVPIELGLGWWLALNAGVVVAIVALLVLPTYIISSVKPEQAIRYQ